MIPATKWAFAALFLAVLAFGLSKVQVTSAALPGPQNPGFELGIVGGAPASWNVVSAPDAAVVVGPEGPAQFPTYSTMGNVTVSPYRGNLMLRLGTPKATSQSQSKGPNTVSQTFTSDGTFLRLSFRIFSWEPRNQDIFGFDLKSGNKSVGNLSEPLVVPMPDGTTRTCTAMPCQFTVDAGSTFLDSGWIPVKMVNVPVGTLTLSYTAGGTGDNAKATWAYFDNVNTPPVAKFTFTPKPASEGVAVQFADLSYDPDPGDHVVSWNWNINGTSYTSQNPETIFANQGLYNATLTVTDTFGDSNTVSSGTSARDGDPVPALAVQNIAPLANALNIEALSGSPHPLLGRFADPGWLDKHTASWSLSDGQKPAATVQEKNNPVLGSGIVTGTATNNSNVTGTMTVNDGDGGVTSVPFNVTTLADTPALRNRFEPNDKMSDPLPVLNANGVYLSFIQSAGDIDLYEARMPDGSMLPAGGQLLVNLFNLPADYDLAILKQPPAGASAALSGEAAPSGILDANSNTANFRQFGFSQIGFSQIGFSQIGFSQIGYSQIGFSQIGFSQIGFSQIGFSQIGFSQIGSEVGATDLSLDQLGLSSIGGTGLQVADFSAHRGLDSETATATNNAAGTRFFIAVSGSNGAHSSQPYDLSLETASPPDLASQLGAACTGSPLVSPANSTNTPTLLFDYDAANTGPDTATTIIVTQQQRIQALYGLDANGWQSFLNDLIALAQQPSVKADIISLPSSVYDTWDSNPCSVDAANSVATQVHDIIGARLSPTVQNVIIAGNDDVVPFRRVADRGVIGNERSYAADSLLKPGSPLFASLVGGYMLSDDYYVSQNPLPGDLFLPSKAIGRMVETPAEIQGQAQAYVNSSGVLNAASGFVSGYDFFQDGADAIGQALDAGTHSTADRLISDSWTAGDLRCHLLGAGTGCTTSPHDISSPNAHYTHYGALSANGFATKNYNDFLSSTDVAAAGGANHALGGKVLFSMGCHSGFNSPDRASGAPDKGVGINPALDFAQAMAEQGAAVYVANTGYGLGDDTGVGGTESLMALFSRKLFQPGESAAQALVDAKSAYISSLSSVTVYDQKVALEAEFYGIPTYTVNGVAPAILQPGPTVTEQQSSVAAALQLTTTDPTSDTPTVTTTSTLAQVITAAGSYFTADGDFQATAGRAIQPRIVADLNARHPHSTGTPPPIEGVMLTGGSYQDMTGFDPVITRPTLEWEDGANEPQSCLAGFWPSQPGSLNNQSLIALGGQFRCTSGSATPVTGVERLYTALNFSVERCAVSDGNPPLIKGIDLRQGSGSDVLMTVDARDPSGISKIVVLKMSGGTITPTTVAFSAPYPTSGPFNLTIPSVADTDDLLVQVEDGGCNVTSQTGKGADLNIIHVNAGPDQVIPASGAVTFTSSIAGFTQLTSPVTYIWDFGDGTFGQGILSPANVANTPVTIDASGNATFSVSHTYTPDTTLPTTATVRVYDSAGGIGVDDVVVRCDPLGDASGVANADFVGCSTTNSSSTMTIALRVAGQISNAYQYRLIVTNVKTKKSQTLKYNGGQITGLPSLAVTVNGNEIDFTFALSDMSLSIGNNVTWTAESQGGIPGVQTAGKIDDMPDTGVFTYTLK